MVKMIETITKLIEPLIVIIGGILLFYGLKINNFWLIGVGLFLIIMIIILTYSRVVYILGNSDCEDCRWMRYRGLD